MKSVIKYFILIMLLFLISSCSREAVIYESDLVDMSVDYVNGTYIIDVDDKHFETNNYKVIIDDDNEIIVYDYKNYQIIEFHVVADFNE